LTECVESVLAQGIAGLELYGVDDGSTDGSGELLRELGRRHGFAVCCQENRGVVPTFNAMVDQARGTYLAPIAGDDRWPLGKLARQLEWLEVHPQALCCGGRVQCITATGEPAEGQRYRELPAGSWSFRQILRGEVEIPSPSLVYRTDWLQANPVPPHIAIEDFWQLLRMAQDSGGIETLPEMLAEYRIHGGNLHRNLRRMVEGVLQTLAEFREHPDYQEARQLWLQGFFSSAAIHDRAFALRLLGPAWSWHPRFLVRVLKLLVPGSLWRRVRGPRRD
jgi:alpha-1,3-rhamnosyltransferase